MDAPLENTRSSTRRIGWLVLICLFATFAAGVAHFSNDLPDRVATHFGANGRPNGWMPRHQYRNFTLAIGIGTPVFIVATFAIIVRLNGWGLNIPHKTYWLDPARRRATFEFVERQGFWLAGLLVVFHGAIFLDILLANARSPVALPTAHFLTVIGGFVAAIAAWATILILRFRRPAG